jgi:hypothetical protein
MKNIHKINENIYITSDEDKEIDWILYCNSVYKVLRINSNNRPVVKMSDGEFELSNWNKIILTTDQDLIKDGVQPIDDDFLEWFIKNPSCEEVEFKSEYLGSKCLKCGFIENHDEVDTEDCPKCHNTIYDHLYNQYKIIIPNEEPTAYHYLSCCRSIEECHCGKYPKQIKCYCGHTTMCDCSPIEPKQETLEKAAETNSEKHHYAFGQQSEFYQIGFIEGVKWQQERRYSEEDMFEFSQWISHEDWVYLPSKGYWVNEEQEELEQKLNSKEILNMWFEQFKKK